ncbi:MAG TPA: DUF2911 domain-containing protein [Cyclobacteriaceae bacterium]|nr:DUF2911 domain-containing protein [Cyclobacteriaceae bacterium]
MKNNLFYKFGMLALSLMLISSMSYAQEKASPAKTAEGTVNGAKIKINYSSPAVKGRTIWGDLVPLGKVWRAGANEATIFETNKDIKIQGKELKAGKYSFYIIPGETESTFIFNSQTGQWGTQYDQSKDVLRVPVVSQQTSNFEERLVYEVTKNGFEVRWADGKGQVTIE